MKKKINIISLITIVLYIILNLITCVTFASVEEIYTPLKEGNNPLNAPAELIIGMIRWVGVAVCIGMIIMKGIKYVTVSPEGKADIKKDIIMITVGAILLFAGTSLIELIYDNVQKAGL